LPSIAELKEEHMDSFQKTMAEVTAALARAKAVMERYEAMRRAHAQ